MGGGFGSGGGAPGGFRGGSGTPSRAGGLPTGARTALPTGAPSSGAPGGGARSGGINGGGGMGGDATVTAALKRALQADAGRYRWVLATSGSQSAAQIELATGEPVMAIGGFSGEGGNLSLAQFERYAAAGDIHYYSASAGGGPGGRGGSTSAITTWVEAHYKAVTIGGQTLYDLTSPK
jgi:hypothetical protein